jgi:hypothetical protein
MLRGKSSVTVSMRPARRERSAKSLRDFGRHHRLPAPTVSRTAPHGRLAIAIIQVHADFMLRRFKSEVQQCGIDGMAE